LAEYTKLYYTKYVGGHIEYPTAKDCRVFLYNDRLELFLNEGNYKNKPSIAIPYKSIDVIESADESKISALRVAMLGIVGGLWKKKHVYTVIRYKDEFGEKTVVIDFGKDVEEAQPLIYHKMLEAKKDGAPKS